MRFALQTEMQPRFLAEDTRSRRLGSTKNKISFKEVLVNAGR
jgi:hypothetical protein